MDDMELNKKAVNVNVGKDASRYDSLLIPIGPWNLFYPRNLNASIHPGMTSNGTSTFGI
jgi:hypothetical protein